MMRNAFLCFLVILASGSALADETSLVAEARLRPSPFPEPGKVAIRPIAGAAITPDPRIQALVDAVSRDTITKYISQLSGNEPVVIGGVLDTLLTRYSYSWRFDHAAQYVYERFQDYGIPVEYHTYTSCTFDFCAGSFLNDSVGWAVGSDAKVFKTTDGGATWINQSTPEAGETFYGVSFVDSATGWIAGTGGTILHTVDGGANWTAQTSGIIVAFREISALDSQNAWVVGNLGKIRRTTDGGATWVGVASGVTADLYGCHFRSNSRGWACGSGRILFWDGTSWVTQTTGVSSDLQDVCFVDDNVGWAVGDEAVILKTIDGGQNWVHQTAPAGVDTYFKGVCFVDSLEGWIVGLVGTIIHTTDGGASWEVQNSGTVCGVLCVDFVDSETGWAVGGGGVSLWVGNPGGGGIPLHTDDGGATWVDQRANLPSAEVKILKNVIATKPGTISTDQVIVCGHADDSSTDPYNLAPGAEDNASGTAAVIEAARVMASTSFKKTIKFCAWSGEEQGLLGSAEYADAARSRGDVIAAVLNFDMIAYINSPPEDVDIVCNDSSGWLADFTIDCANAYVPELPTLKLNEPLVRWSDHYMFWHFGYDAILAADDFYDRHPYTHTVNDTLGTLYTRFCKKVVKMGVAAAAELAEIGDAASVPVAGSVAVPSAVGACPNPCVAGAAGTAAVAGTRVSFTLGSPSAVAARVYDVRGRVVRTLFDGSLPAGTHRLVWQGDEGEGAAVAPGVYLITVETVAGKRSTKVVVLR